MEQQPKQEMLATALFSMYLHFKSLSLLTDVATDFVINRLISAEFTMGSKWTNICTCSHFE